MTNQDPWDVVMKLAQKHGFITMAAGGVAMLMSHEVQKEQGIFEEIQKINGVKTTKEERLGNLFNFQD